MLKVKEHTPSEAREIAKKNESLVDLLEDGYDRPVLRKELAWLSAAEEYHAEDERAIVLLAQDGDDYVGSLVLSRWQYGRDPEGGVFWPKLHDYAPAFATIYTDELLSAFSVSGVVTDPNRRGDGIASAMYAQAVEVHKPTIFVGQTKTPGAVRARSALRGYRTFYGNHEVTRGAVDLDASVCEPIRRAYQRTQKPTFVNEEGTVFTYKGDLRPTLPDLQGYPEIIVAAFQPVINAQRQNRETVMASLISVQDSFLRG